MAFDVSGLSAYTQNNSKEIAVKAVTTPKTAKLLISNKRMIAGIKTKEAIRTMDADVQVQENTGCGRNPQGATTLGEVFLEVGLMKDEQNFCAKSLRNTVYAEYLAKGQAPSEEISSELAQSIMDYRAAKVAAEIENILWKSDKTITGTTNYNKIDGIQKQVSAGFAITASGSDMIQKLKSVHLAMPVEIRGQEDYFLFVGEDVYEEYLSDLDNANKFREGSKDVLSGTSAKLFPTPGLNGSNKVYAIRLSNLAYGVDGEGDADKASFQYSNETQQYYMDFYWAVGIKVIRPAEVGVATV